MDDDLEMLQTYYSNYCDNERKNVPQATQKNKRPLKTFRQRIKGKTGRVRGNLMGKRVNFSDPYYRSGITFVIRAADQSKYPHTESLRGKTLCAQLGSVSAMKAEEFSPSNVKTFNDAYAGYLELKSGGCEAMVNDRPVNLYFMASQGSEGMYEIDELLDAENMAMVVPKGNDELLEQVNTALKALRDNGTYQQIYDKWFANTSK